jgi:hypothetical protein
MAIALILSVGLFLGLQRVAAQDSGKWEKITDVSPDKKFGARITCESEPENPANIDPAAITDVELVSLPSKKRVMGLARNYDGAPGKIYWSQDSNWLALSVSEGPRATDTYVYRRGGPEFEKLDTEDMRVETKGDVRNQYIEPIRWLKPGTLLLKQLTIFRSGAGDSPIQFAARFDVSGKFHVVSKKKMRSKDE